jgi:hypothetical protein
MGLLNWIRGLLPPSDFDAHLDREISFMAQRVVAWARQQQAESFQLPPPGADPVASDEELLRVARSPVSLDDARRRAIYERGRADEREAIAKALGVEP